MNRRTRILVITAITLIAVAALLYAADAIPLQRGVAAWRAGHDDEAVTTCERWISLPFRRAQYDQLLAIALLTSGHRDRAESTLQRLRSERVQRSVIAKEDVARRLFARGAYDDFLAYDAASQEASPDSPMVGLYRTAALAMTGHEAEAGRAFQLVNPAGVDPRRYEKLRAAMEGWAHDSVPFIFDRNGGLIAAHNNAGTDISARAVDFAPLIDRAAGSLTIGSNLAAVGTRDQIETTLDPELQRAAIAALGTYRGSLVAIDPATNEILAIASTRGAGPESNLAVEAQYEPGSVIKVLTGVNAIDSGIALSGLFPYDCKGSLDIDGRRFGDWVPAGHGVLPTIDQALADSCNIAFADIGMRLGAERIRRFMVTAGFDGSADTGMMRIPLGRNVGVVTTRFDTASYAIGLEHESITTLHLAMIASMMANRGLLTSPRLLKDRVSVIGDVVSPAVPQTQTRIASVQACDVMIHAMAAVATDPGGTGHRAQVDGVSLAMKTGTAGKRANGFQALIVAFAPIEKPRIAFALIAEAAGPAEFAGAKIAHDFVAAAGPRLRTP